MKYETYCGIVSLIHQHSRPGDRKKCMKILLRDFPGFDVQTLGSIYSQEILKKVSGMMMTMMTMLNTRQHNDMTRSEAERDSNPTSNDTTRQQQQR